MILYCTSLYVLIFFVIFVVVFDMFLDVVIFAYIL